MQITDIHKLDDNSLGQLIGNTVDSLPEADPARLAVIRDRLPLSTRPQVSNRWAQIILIGVLSGSGLAAAWWGVEQLFFTGNNTTESQAISDKNLDPVQGETSPQPGNKQSEQLKHGDDRRSPIIYQQEQY